MSLLIHIQEALANLITSKLRSFLAILGVVVGTGSVVALISSSQLATQHALEQFKSLGTNLLSMSVQQSSQAQTAQQKQQLQFKDMPILRKSSDEITNIAPYMSLYQSITFHGKDFSGQIIAATQALGKIAKIDVKRGRFVSFLDRHSFYCVIGSKLAKQIKAMGVDPLYKQIRLGSRVFTIIGVAKPWQPNLFLFVDVNSGVIIPLESGYLLSKNAQINNVLFRLVQNPNLTEVQNVLTEKVKQLLPSKRVKFRNPEQIIQIVAKQRTTFTWLLAAIGGISLLVGGIGVMNIMLVSVVERRREIGIRMAIGARHTDILTMFLIESIILTVFGGIIGIIVGVGISFVLALVTRWTFQLFLLPPILGFVVSVLVGMISGFYPALRASKLRPIETLHAD